MELNEGHSWSVQPAKWDVLEISPENALRQYCPYGRIDVALVTVNQEEFKAAIQKFSLGKPDDHRLVHWAFVGELTVYFGKVVGPESDPLGVAIIKQDEIGGHCQAADVATLVEQLKPRAIISVGVGWGNQDKCKGGNLGDVMVSKFLVEFAENTKLDRSESGRLMIETRSPLPPAGALLVKRFSGFANPGHWKFAFSSDGERNSQIHMGKFASGGNLHNNEEHLKALLINPSYKDVIGGDMEAWGLYSASQRASREGLSFEWIVVKGICDWGFGKDDCWQPFAAAAATNLVHSVLSGRLALYTKASQRGVPTEMGSWFVGCIQQCDLPLPLGQAFATSLQSAVAICIPDANVEVHPGGSLIIYISGLSTNSDMIPEIKSGMENIWILLGNAIANIKEDFSSLEVGPLSSLQHNSGIVLSGYADAPTATTRFSTSATPEIKQVLLHGEGHISLIGYNFAEGMALFITCQDLVEGQMVSVDSLCRGPDGAGDKGQCYWNAEVTCIWDLSNGLVSLRPVQNGVFGSIYTIAPEEFIGLANPHPTERTSSRYVERSLAVTKDHPMASNNGLQVSPLPAILRPSFQSEIGDTVELKLIEVQESLTGASRSIEIASQLVLEHVKVHDTNEKVVCDLVIETAYLALEYRDQLLPESLEMVRNLQDFLENYTLISLEDFREELPEIARMAAEYRDQAYQVGEDYHIAAAKFNLLEAKAKKVATELSETSKHQTTRERQAMAASGTLVALGSVLGMVGFTVAAVATGGFAVVGAGITAAGIAAGGASMGAHKAAQTASVHAKKATATYDMVEGGLTGCLQQFQKSLRAVAAFLDVLAHEVDGIHQNTLRAQEAQAAGRSIMLHYKKVQAKAKFLVPQCRMFVVAASEAKTNLMAVQLTGIVTSYKGKYQPALSSEPLVTEILRGTPRPSVFIQEI